jgi:hypothetical protein
METTMRTSDAPPADRIRLKDGRTLPVAALELALDLERRGVQLVADDSEVLFVGPLDRLTDDDHRDLRRWKWHLLALLDSARQP